MTILITGATGNVGRATRDALTRRGHDVRIAVTQGRPSASNAPSDTNVVPLDFLDRTTFARALTGVRAVFLLRPPAISDVASTLNVFIDEAAAQGVRHVVFVSVAGADRNRFIPHAKVEEHLRNSDVAWTFLRPGFFAQNLGDAYRQDIIDDDRIFVPAGRGRAAFVDVRDVAEVAALAFEEERHHAQAYVLTGGEELGFDDAAALLTRALERTVRYEAASIPAYALHLRRRRGMPFAQIAVQTTLHALLRRRGAAPVDPTLQQLLLRPPTSLAAYIHDHAQLWRPVVERAA
jgi:uncharacterized protein YbjT (DUF2867 family)